MMMLSRKQSWIVLTICFLFDSIWSYIGVVYLQLREINLVIQSIVEQYPLIYFLYIPLEYLIIFALAHVFAKISQKLFHFQNKYELLYTIALGACAIFWVVGNSSVNMMAVFFRHLPNHTWTVMMILGVVVSIIYARVCLKRAR